MKRNIILIPFLIFLMGMVSLAWAVTINVPLDQPTIQAAVTAANDGDLIQIAAGTYTEHITVDKRLSFIGAGSGSDPVTNTVITNPAESPTNIGVFQFTASGLSNDTPILLQDIRINAVGKAGLSVGRLSQADGVSVSYLKFNNVKVYGTNTNPSSEQERGFYVDVTSSASYLVFENCSFNNLTYGWYLHKQISADASSVSYVSVTNSTFNHNNHKGIYAEKLDHASFYGCTFDDNGYDASVLPTYFYDWCAGVDINLKAGNYSSFLFEDCIITNNGTGGSKEGAGMAVKGRGTGTDTSYATFPAYVSDVTISGCTVTGNERGIRFGEPGKIIDTPTQVVIEDCTIHSNVKTWSGTTGSLYGDIISLLSHSDVLVDDDALDGGKAMWFTIPGLSLQNVINNATAGNVINVASGTYTENIIINKALTLKGANADTPYGSRIAGSIIAPSSGLPVSIVADNVTFNGFEVTAPGYQYAISCGGSYSDISIKYNYLHHIATTMNNVYVHAIVYQVANGVNPVNLSITDNRIQYVGSTTHTNSSVAAIGILQSASTGTLTGLNILRNVISDVEVSTANWPTGKLAYGIILNTGSANYQTATGKIIDANVEYNTIYNIKGFIATAIGMEGNTENAFVRYNNVSYLTANKLDVRAGGGYDMNALKFESNRYVGSVTVTDNVFQTDTFIHNGTPNLGYAVSNYVPSSVGVLNMSKNWYGTAVLADILDNDTLTGKLFNKADCVSNFLPYSTSPDPLNSLGLGPVVNVTADTSYLTIQAAIDAAAPGSVINIAAGTYNEVLLINKPLSLIGADGAVLDGTGLGTAKVGVTIKSGNVTFDNIDVLNFSGNGILCGYEASIPGSLPNIQIKNCEIGNIQPGSSHGFGIYAGYESEGWTYSTPKLTDHLDYSGLIIENNVIYNTANAGITLQAITANTGVIEVTGNHVYGLTNSAIWIDCARNLSIEDNLLDDCNYGIFFSAIPEGWYVQDGPYSAQNVTISGNEITNHNSWGIGPYNCWPSTVNIYDNNISGNTTGINYGLSGALNASANWWGDATGPHASTNTDGLGNAVSNNVVYDPWWANEGMTLVGSNAPVENVTQNLFYQNIQDAIDAANDNDVIHVAAGQFDQTMNIVGKTGISITGAGENLTIFKPSTAVPWDYFGHTTGRRSAIRIVESTGITVSGITLDCDLIKNNGWYGAFVGNASATIQNSTLKNMYTDQSHYYDIMIYARSLSPYSDTNRTNLNVLGCKLIDTGRVGIVTHDYVHSVIDGNQIYKTTNTFGYGMEIGSASTAVITNNDIYGFDTPAVSDGSVSGGIYIENAYTNTVVDAIEKLIIIEDNEVSDCQIGLTVGNQFNNYAGNVDIVLEVTDNSFINNIDYGVLLTDEDKSNGSSVTAVLTGNTISSSLATPDASGVMVYAVGDGNLAVSLLNNVVTGYDFGLLVYDSGNPAGSDFVLSATGNTFSNAEYGVYTGNVNWIPVRLDDNPYYSGNTFQDNTIHMDNTEGEEIDMEAVVAANTFVGGAYQFDQIIYSSTAGVIYADAPEELIKDNEEQIYSIKAVATENLRGATVRIVISAVDFAQPHTFAMGANFEFMDIVESHTLTEWIYDVTVSTLGTGGVTANDYVFFTWKMSSLLNAQNLAGSIIGVPYDNITMYDEMNQPIAILGSADAVVIIDSGEPTLVQGVVNAGLYHSGMLLSIDPAGTGLLVRPTLQYDATDDYNLDYTRYLIYPDGGTIPVAIADFSAADAMGAVDGTTSVVNWQLPAIVDTYADGIYIAYFLVVDDAGNFNISTWNFVIDKSAPAIPAWTSCLTTPDSNNSVDLVWTGTADKYDIWVLNYSELDGAGVYPLYNPANITPEIPAAPNAYSALEQNHWTRLADDVAALSYIHTPATRGYYYYYIFAQDLAGNFSAASQRKESISYWPGDVSTATDGEVTATDIALLADVWGLLSGHDDFDEEFDVGPSVGRARRGRPTPDGRINIEDLMMFSMNYENTNYGTYPRSTSDSRPLAVKIQMQQQISGNELSVNFMLTENNGEIKGLNIPMEYGSGLELISFVQGPVWGDESMVLYTNEIGVIELSGARLDAGFLEGNGLVASLVFKINGQETELTLKHMIARAVDNSDIDIIDNPENTPSDIDDPAIIPTVSFLGSAYPNPFNPSTTISFGLNESGSVNVKVYNARGQLVDTLVNGELQAGLHTVVWNGLDHSGRPMGSGIYFIRMQTRSTDQTIKTTLIK